VSSSGRMAQRIALEIGALFLLVVLSNSRRVSGFPLLLGAPRSSRTTITPTTGATLPRKRTTRICVHELWSSSSSSSDDGEELDEESLPSISGVAVSLDPASDQAAAICCDHLGLTDDQFALILELTAAVCEWNDKINLVSRRDCRPSTVLARHVLPSLACGAEQAAAATDDDDNNNNNPHVVSPLSSLLNAPGTRVMDVGTGGGFPGLPLSIQYPATQFVLADSVGKKISAVQDMAEQLRLANVQTYHGRVEDYFVATSASGKATERFDVVTGRSVTALPQFCAWVQHLLKRETGHLVYWIGGDIDSALLERTKANRSIQELIPDWSDNHDKRILVFPAAAVRAIAAESGIVVKPTRGGRQPKNTTAASKRQQARLDSRKKKQTAKGAWRKKTADEPRQRGYDNFKRYSSLSSSSSPDMDKHDETR